MSEDKNIRPEGTLPRVRHDRFGWQPGDELAYYDDEGNRISEAEWKRQVLETEGPGAATSTPD